MHSATENLIEAPATDTPIIDPWNQPRAEDKNKRKRTFASLGIIVLALSSLGVTFGGFGLAIYEASDAKDYAVAKWDGWFAKEEKKKVAPVRPRDEVERKGNFIEPGTVDAPLPVPHIPRDPKGVAQKTETKQVGNVKVVMLGSQEPSFKGALEEQTKQAKASGKDILVMTTDESCKPCNGFLESVRSDLMQTALESTVLVVVNTDVFRDDLKNSGMDPETKPWFYLLRSDMSVRDGITGGEWGEDIAENIAPVLGPFVRGELKKRKAPFKQHPGGGVFL